MFTPAPAKRNRNQKQVLPRAPSKQGGRGGNKFSALLSEEDATAVAVATVVKPVSLTIDETGKWGEDEYVPNPCTGRWIREVESQYWIHKPVVYQPPEADEEEAEAADWYDQEQELWSQPFAVDLEMKDAAQDVFDCQGLTEEAYADFMTFLYERGWIVRHEERRFVQATTGSEPPRVWVPPVFKATIPIFCKKAQDCFEQNCRYVHGDTIPKIKEICKFAATCGASDPTGAKRAHCIRIHPGESWSPEACIHR